MPPVIGLVGALWAARVVPTLSWRSGALRGLGGGALGGLLLTVATAWAGGSIGPGRMADIGAPLVDLLLWNVAGLGLGGLVGGLAATWWARRHDVAEAVAVPRTRTERPITLYPHLARQRSAPVDRTASSAGVEPALGSRSGDGAADSDLTEPVLSAAVRRRLAESGKLPGWAHPAGGGPAGRRPPMPASDDTVAVDPGSETPDTDRPGDRGA